MYKIIPLLITTLILTACTNTTSQKITDDLSSNTSTKILFHEPLINSAQRTTKKPFGIHITPQNSPVSPEKFTGYHTGTDFEILEGEEDTEVPIFAICTGQLVYKNHVNGYGGVAIQQCDVSEQPSTVLYGHLKTESITAKLKQQLIQGNQIAILGQAYTAETSGERKHLHLGIHKGTEIEFKGYTQNKSDLANWINPETLFQ